MSSAALSRFSKQWDLQQWVDKLDYFESIWVSNLDAKINIAKTSLPKIK